MSKITLNSLKLKGFRSFVDESTIELPSTGLLHLQGLSGYGKSSINLAISYVLGYCNIPSKYLQSWFDDSPKMQVQLECTIDENKVIISRGKDNNFIERNGILIAKGTSALNEGILKLFGGLNEDIRRVLTYRPQGERSNFLSKTDALKKDLLTELLNLKSFDDSTLKYSKVLYDLQKELENITNKINDKQVEIETFKCSIKEPVLQSVEHLNTENSVLQSNISKLSEELDGTQVALDYLELNKIENKQVIVDIKTKIDKVSNNEAEIDLSSLSPLAETIDNYKKQLDNEIHVLGLLDISVSNNYLKTFNLKKEVKNYYKNLCNLQDECKLLEKDINGLLASKNPICDKCNRTMDVTLSQDLQAINDEMLMFNQKSLMSKNIEIELINNSINSKTEEINNLESSVVNSEEALKYTKSAISKLELDINEKNLELYRFKKDLYSSYNKDMLIELREEERIEEERIANVNNKLTEFTKKANLVSNEIEKHRIQIKENNSKIELIEKSNKNQLDNYNKSLDFLNTLESRLSLLFKEKSYSEEKINKTEDFLELISKKGFIGHIFHEILDELTNESNNILKNIPNVANCSIQFDSQTEIQSGETRNKINNKVYVNGYLTEFDAGLSGGMKSAVELAVDIALSNIISKRTGFNLGWFILDEAFDGLGIEKENCFEILKSYSNDKLIIVVDHDSKFNEFFDKNIQVECKNGRSKVQNP